MELVTAEECPEVGYWPVKWSMLAEIWLLLKDCTANEGITCYCSRVILDDRNLYFKDLPLGTLTYLGWNEIFDHFCYLFS